ncbi:molybdenum cofactor guanylyltransferase [Asticcacaulis endophyticus]|nr:molybdenum cofactor guanylyltransferase [Asticcacaulis endophyticus]
MVTGTDSMIVGVILAGGQGQRMGGNKPFAIYDHAPLISHAIAALTPQVSQLLVNAGEPISAVATQLRTLKTPLIYDDPAIANLGPLSGIHTGLKAAIRLKAKSLISLPCDMPHIPVTMVKSLVTAQMVSGADIIYIKGQRDHPLCALWQPSVFATLDQALRQADGGLGVLRFLSTQKISTLTPNDERAYTNINSLADLGLHQPI